MTAAPATAAGTVPPLSLETSPRRELIRGHAPALTGYLLLALAFFWPVTVDFATRLLSEPGDGSAFLWNMWAIPRAVFRGDSPFATHEIFYPLEARTSFNTNIPLVALVSWPFAKVFGLTVATNLVQLAAVVLTGLGTYMLAFHQCGDRVSSFFAGVAFTYVPYRFIHLPGHHNLNHTEFLPFGFLALLCLYERPTRRRAGVYGLVLGLTFLTDLSYTLFLLIGLVVVAAWRWRETLRDHMPVRLAEAGIVAALVASPLLLAMAVDLVAYDWLDPLPGWGGAQGYSADVLSWVTPSRYHPLWGGAFTELYETATGGERLAFPGYAVLALALGGAVAGARRTRGVWVALAGTFFVLSLGPFLHVNGWTGSRFEYLGARFSVPLPYAALHFVPVLNGVRVPGRFSIAGILALDVLAAMALARVATRAGLARAIAGLAIGLTLVEFLAPRVPYQYAHIPPAYSAIAEHPDRGAVMEIPIGWRTGFGSVPANVPDPAIHMYYATRHSRPLVSGMAARFPDKKIKELTDIPVYRQVLALQGGEGFNDPARFSARDLRSLGIGFVVYHRDRPAPAALSYIKGLGMQVLVDDGTVIVWEVP